MGAFGAGAGAGAVVGLTVAGLNRAGRPGVGCGYSIFVSYGPA